MSGLVKFIPLEEMQRRRVVIVANLKAGNMRGIKSQAMVLAASSADGSQVLSNFRAACSWHSCGVYSVAKAIEASLKASLAICLNVSTQKE